MQQGQQLGLDLIFSTKSFNSLFLLILLLLNSIFLSMSLVIIELPTTCCDRSFFEYCVCVLVRYGFRYNAMVLMRDIDARVNDARGRMLLVGFSGWGSVGYEMLLFVLFCFVGCE